MPITKISLNEASNYISQKEDNLNSPLRYYTLELDDDGWDKMTFIKIVVKETNGYMFYQTHLCLTF